MKIKECEALDKINQEILSQLLKKPQKPFLKISEELGISPITVKNRYEKMKKTAQSWEYQ